MQEEKITKELVQKLMETKGECRGENIRVDWEYILNREGQKGLEEIEKKMEEVGYPLKYKDIKPMDYYPIGLDAISMLVIKEVFKFDDKDVEEMGASAMKFSMLIKVFFRYFGSLQMIASEIPRMWPKHYTLGILEMPDFSNEKKYIIVKLKNFHVHPIFCTAFKGSYRKVAELIVNSPAIIEETKCSFRGDEYEEYYVRW